MIATPNFGLTTAELAAKVAAQAAELDALRRELSETNRGVVALYAELDANAQLLTHATELKSRFLAYMSHEFRTPIATIRSMSRLLFDRIDGPLTPEQERQVVFIQKISLEFSEMVDDLLDLAKVEAGRIDISPEWFQMVDLFSTLRGIFKPVLTNPAVALIFEEPRDPTQMFNDSKKLAQILRNFISNGLKFTSKGEVRVSAALDHDDTVTFAVTDTGVCIEAKFHDAIFEDFAQIDSPIQRPLKGTGLGLSLSKRLAGLLGGTVHLQSQLGRGSRFSVRLPLQLRLSAPDAAKEP